MLSKRLLIISRYINDDDIVADIGTDSGQLPFYLAKNGHKYVYASDNKKGPYDNLVKKISENNLENIIETKLEDGLNNLPSNVNTVVIAGMGGELIRSILIEGREYLFTIKKLILAPNCQEPTVRRTLMELGFGIIEEEVIKDGRHYYEIIVAIPKISPLTPAEIEFGPINLQKKSSIFKEKWAKAYLANARLLQKDDLPPYRRIEIMQIQERIKEING
ncbi:MAG: tRNA (adenine(22)-N(1))-methyltransferase [Bacilli bacterium]|jgi:tRNA (adenine22-N1)-methyltransferase